MNDTASAGGATGASLIPDTTDAFTIAHLAIVAIFAIVVIAAIVWGARLKARRKGAEQDIAAHNAEVERLGNGRAEAARDAIAQRDAAPVAPNASMPAAAPVGDPPTPDAAPESDASVEAAPLPPLADEPIPAASALEAAPATEAASVPTPSPESEPKQEPAPAAAPAAEPAPLAAAAVSPAEAPVTTLKGLGPKLAARLGELGITTVGDVAALDDDAAARLDAQLGPFSGRLHRDRWIEQARFLAAGDRAGFEAVFGRL